MDECKIRRLRSIPVECPFCRSHREDINLFIGGDVTWREILCSECGILKGRILLDIKISIPQPFLEAFGVERV